MPELVDPVVPPGRLNRAAQPRINVGDLVLRPWVPADVHALVAAYSDPAIRHWHVRSMTETEASEWVASRSDRWDAETGADWAVSNGDRVVGRVALRAISLAEGWGEAAYWVVPGARGQGVATRALCAMTDWMFDEVGLHRIELVHSVANAASCGVALNAGYTAEGTKRLDVLHHDGWHDMHLHARIAPGARSAPDGSIQR